MFRRICLSSVLIALLASVNAAVAAPPSFEGAINGRELLPQSLFGAALFVFEYRGLVDGRQRRGWGWIAVNHEELPAGEGETALIAGGEGEIFVGFRRYDVDVNGGLLTLTDIKDPDVFDDVFGVQLSVDICRRGECAEHLFDGELNHEPFIPTIIGGMTPAP